MASVQRVDDLEVGQDVDFNRREWAVQRVGWVVMALVVLAALLGLTGSGVLARASVGDAGDPLRFEYSRFDRLEAPTTLDARIDADAVGGGQVELWVDRAYLQGVQVQKITPEPEAVRSGADRLIYVFGVDEPGQPITVTFDLQHTSFGWASGRVGLVDGPSLDFGQLVFP